MIYFYKKDQLVSIVNMLMVKIPPVECFDFQSDRFKNLEALALSYIFAVIFILFIYDTPPTSTLEQSDRFCLKDWIKSIQVSLSGLKRIKNGKLLELFFFYIN